MSHTQRDHSFIAIDGQLNINDICDKHNYTIHFFCWLTILKLQLKDSSTNTKTANIKHITAAAGDSLISLDDTEHPARATL